PHVIRSTGRKRSRGKDGRVQAFYNVTACLRISSSARNQSSSGEPAGRPRCSQYMYARSATSSRSGGASTVASTAALPPGIFLNFVANDAMMVISYVWSILLSSASGGGGLEESSSRHD